MEVESIPGFIEGQHEIVPEESKEDELLGELKDCCVTYFKTAQRRRTLFCSENQRKQFVTAKTKNKTS